MRLTTRSSISGSTAAPVTGCGCLLDGLRVLFLTSSTLCSTTVSATGYAILLACALALDWALG